MPNPTQAPNAAQDAKAAPARTAAPPLIERLEYGLPRPPEEAGLHSATGSSPLPAFQSVTGGKSGASRSVGSSRLEDPEPAAQAANSETHWAQVVAELEARMAREKLEAAQAISVARDEGRREGQHAAESTLHVDRQRNHTKIADAVEAFRNERQKYFKDVEREVVRLSLSIAARVLHREAQMDPLFLAGAVRVALDTLADSSGVVLRVAPAQVLVWQENFRLSANAHEQPEILGDMSLSPGECVLETRMGTIEVGVRAQLEEIDKGFFDLLDQRPALTANASRRAV